MDTVNVDFTSAAYGEIRPLHGVNQGPMTKVFTYDARELFRKAGIPFSRLHDTEYPYGSGEFVDIPCVFKNFDADENDPSSYNFGLTDEYIRCIAEVGTEPFYRLGVSIEHAPVKRYIYPPKDFAKWARICEHIIRHYTEGWADGMNLNMRYWEIWNEPDGHGNMWYGTDEQFIELYSITATHLKKCFPNLKIGGPAFCSPLGDVHEDFVREISKQKIQLDFYSWHYYGTDVRDVIYIANETRKMLDYYGYTATESVFDEWNYMANWGFQGPSYRTLRGNIGAAYCAAMLSGLQQNTDISHAEYFEADTVKEWCGLWEVENMSIGGDKASLRPLKPFYAFEYFNRIYHLKNAVMSECSSDNLYSCAAHNNDNIGIMVSNYDESAKKVNFHMRGLSEGIIEIKITDENRTNTVIGKIKVKNNVDFMLNMPENSVVYIGSTDN